MKLAHQEVAQLVSEEQLAKIVVGKTTRAEVRQLLGKPAQETVYYIGPTWYWRYAKGGLQPGGVPALALGEKLDRH